MSSTSYQIIRQAMEDLSQVHTTYQGHHRELCVHEIGIGPKGNEQILAYQFGGSSSKGLASDMPEKDRWRCLDIAQMQDIAVVAGPWHTGANRGPGNYCIEATDLAIHP
jgi:hypothetical protein